MQFRVDGSFPFIHTVQAEERATVNWPSAELDLYFGGPSYQINKAGVTVSEETALKQSAYWRAINLLSSQIASFPIGLFKRLGNGDTEEIHNHPSIRLIRMNPNAGVYMTPFVWRESMQANVLVMGNAYAYIQKDAQGRPISLKMLDPVNINPESNGDVRIYRYPDGYYDPHELLHIPGLGFDGVKGRAVIEVAAESMGVNLAMQKYSANLFKNGAKQTGVLMHPQSLSNTARDGLRKSFNSKLKDKDGGTMILDEGMKWQATGIPPDQAQLLESKQFSVQEIARWFGIPPYMLFEESRSTFNNISEQGTSFVRYTLTQWVQRWEAELDYKLLSEREKEDHFFKFNMNSLMRGNHKDRADFYAKMQEYGNMSINEVRHLEELNSIPGGDNHLVQVNREPINKIKKDEGKAI